MKLTFLETYSVLVSALLPTIFILKCSSLNLWNVGSVINWKNWVLVLVTVIVTGWIVSKKEVKDLPTGKKLLQYAVDGVIMEIPQRMMMQSFIYTLLMFWGRNVLWSLIITAFIWCLSICIQCLIVKIRFDKSVIYELLASFVFSIGVGYVLINTEFIGFTMVAHFMERIFSTFIRRKYR